MCQNDPRIPAVGIAAIFLTLVLEPSRGQEPGQAVMRVRGTQDFTVTGSGDTPAWRMADGQRLTLRGQGTYPYETTVKMLYSASGLYVFMEGTDRVLSATMQDDFLDLWTEDVYEFFLWPDERYPIYFEYEISPLGYELPILIPNLDGQFLGWRPWHYEEGRKTRKAVRVLGGPAEPGARITGWRAEVFVPYDLLKPLTNVPPKPGTKWRANFYRVDYDEGKSTAWDWARVGPSFHEFQKFGSIVFE